MKIHTTAIVFITFLLCIGISAENSNYTDYDYYENEAVYLHQEHRLCDSRHCENTCERPDAESRPCPFKLCHEGYFCESGYVRDIHTDQCILPSDCSPPDTMNG